VAPRASWKGYIKLSLVSCPVKMYPATSTSERITFNQLHKDTHNRINMKPVDPELGLVERSDLSKATSTRTSSTSSSTTAISMPCGSSPAIP